MIYFRKILRYELSPFGEDVFEYLADVTAQKIDPQSLQQGEFFVDKGIVLFSPLRRARECLSTADGVQRLELAELREIPFDIRRICDKNEWEKEKSLLVRRKFKEAFIADTLSVSRKQIFKEIKSVLGQCKILHESGPVTVLSHSFRLKLIEGYIKSKGKIVSSPETIHDFIFDDQKTYDFGGGFEIDELK